MDMFKVTSKTKNGDFVVKFVKTGILFNIRVFKNNEMAVTIDRREVGIEEVSEAIVSCFHEESNIEAILQKQFKMEQELKIISLYVNAFKLEVTEETTEEKLIESYYDKEENSESKTINLIYKVDDLIQDFPLEFKGKEQQEKWENEFRCSLELVRATIYADRWARYMQEALARGVQLSSEMIIFYASEASIKGIEPIDIILAITMLAEVWRHGEQFQKAINNCYHNFL